MRRASRGRAQPGLSIIVLTRNRRDILRGCLGSLRAQRGVGTSFEVLVIDDGSSDGTGDMVRRLMRSFPGLSYHPQPHRGIAAARNSGLRRAGGRLVAIVADDYLLAPDYARTVVRFFREHPGARVVRFKITAADGGFISRVCHAYQEASVVRRLAEGADWTGHRNLWRRFAREDRLTSDHGLEAAGGAAFRRNVFDRVGLFDESLARAEDSDFSRRLRTAGIPIHYYPFHEIRHRYGSSFTAALGTSFSSGRYRRRYYAKYAEGRLSILALVGMGLTMKVSALYWSFWRARVAVSPARLVLYLPFLLLLEAANKAGFLAEGLSGGRRA